jgi:hypothetical protein
MNRKATFDYATPYQLMVGVWDGIASEFGPDGEFRGSYASRVAIYWKTPGEILCFRQVEQSNPIHFDEKGGKAARKFGESVLHIDFDVDGKRANSPDGEVTALETTPGTYIFHIKRPDGTHYYNNQYFVNENERRIIGPYTEGDSPKIAGVLSQVFTRLSYDVPDRFKRPVRFAQMKAP